MKHKNISISLCMSWNYNTSYYYYIRVDNREYYSVGGYFFPPVHDLFFSCDNVFWWMVSEDKKVPRWWRKCGRWRYEENPEGNPDPPLLFAPDMAVNDIPLRLDSGAGILRNPRRKQEPYGSDLMVVSRKIIFEYLKKLYILSAFNNTMCISRWYPGDGRSPGAPVLEAWTCRCQRHDRAVFQLRWIQGQFSFIR